MEIVLMIVAFPILTLALVGLRYMLRETSLHRVRAGGQRSTLPAVSDEAFAPSMELLARIELTMGNDAELLTDGDSTFPRLFGDLRAATRSITMQMYYCQPGVVADEVHGILCDRARAGVRVLFLHDAFGSQKLSREYLDSLRAAGVDVKVFRPVHWWTLEKAYARSHIRVVVVDGRIGYTGGFGLDDKWLGDGLTEEQWRDTNVRFTGPAVLQLQATFAAGWAEAAGELLTGDFFFPVEEYRGASGGLRAAVLHTVPTIGSTTAERFLALSIASARRTLYVTNAYFVPDDEFVELLIDAVRRGVDVRLLTAGKRSDVKTTLYAGRAKFEALLAGGVRIYEYLPTMIHAKTLVADGLWCSVGTMNFDNRSLSFNDESNLVAYDAAFGARCVALFEEDLTHAHELDLATFRRRPWRDKLLERGATLFARLL